MSDEASQLRKAARQLIETDTMLGGQFIPARRNPLPKAEPRTPRVPDQESGHPEMTKEQKAQALADLNERQIQPCKLCPLSESRTLPVFGEGNPDADIVFVGEAPGAEEDRTGRPFVGRAGQLLTDMIAAMGLTREDIYICNMLKCRPPNNRTPNPQEIQCCWDYLVRQLQIIRPKVIITLGNPATKGLLNTKIGITRLRGQWQSLPDIGAGLEGIPVMPTFHPSYVLRQYTPDNRRNVWSDLQQVMGKLGLKAPKKTDNP